MPVIGSIARGRTQGWTTEEHSFFPGESYWQPCWACANLRSARLARRFC